MKLTFKERFLLFGILCFYGLNVFIFGLFNIIYISSTALLMIYYIFLKTNQKITFIFYIHIVLNVMFIIIFEKYYLSYKLIQFFHIIVTGIVFLFIFVCI